MTFLEEVRRISYKNKDKEIKQIVEEFKSEIKEAAKKGRCHYEIFLYYWEFDKEIYERALQILKLEGFSINTDFNEKNKLVYKICISWE